MDIGWLIAIVFVVLFLIARNKLKVLRARVAHEEYERQRVLTTNRNLVVLRRQFKRMLKDEELDESDFEQLAEKIDACLMSAPKNKLPIMPRDRWWSCCEAGWHTLTALELVPHGPPPWYKETETPEPGVTTHPPASEDIVAEKAEERLTILPPEIPSPLPPDRASVPPGVAKPEKISSVAPVGSAGAHREEQAAESSERPAAVAAHALAKHLKSTAAAREFAWRPAAPGSLERALHAISGWPKILVPFLVQNIGWFIGTFLFLAGSVFLVTYTTGFIKAAIVFASLFAYTLFLIWAGYKLLRLRTRLAAASAVLLSTGMLLVPLTISAVTQLLMNAGSALLLWIVGIAAALSSLVVFYIAAQVVSGVVHRSLRGHYPRLFLAGAAIQLGAPLIAVWPSWQTLAPLHLLLLGLLAYGLLRFTHEWLHTIFVDGEKVAFFAAGLLLYAVGTSFVHLTWGVRPVPIPAGYYAPYLMAVCGLLFYLDASFKTHAHRHVFLSHFTFLVYGVSVVAVLLSLDAPVVRLITLGMAAALYTMVLIKYLTLIPFYLMIASLAGLYTDGILTHFSPSTHLLIATPGLYGLIRLSSWAIQRGFSKPVTGPGDLQRIGLITYRIALLFLAGLTVWTLTYSTRGFTAMATGLVVSGFLVWMLRTAPGRVTTLLRTPDETGGLVSLLDGPWLYAPIGALTVGLVFAPPIGGVLWSIQSAAVLMMLSVLWGTLFVLGRRPDNRRPAAQIEVLANSVLLGLFASTALVALATSVALETSGLEILILAAGAALLFTLSVNLYVDWLFYASLLWVAATAVAVKGTYFPQQGVGITEMLVVAAIWGVTWWLGRQPDEWSLTAKRRAQRHAPRHLLWLFPCASEVSEAPSVIDTSIGGDSMRSPSPHDVNAEGSPTEDRRDV